LAGVAEMALNLKLPEDHRQVIRGFIRSKVGDSGTNGVVLGLSGGLDSAVVAKLCSDAIGPERTHVLLMPENRKSDPHFKDAEELAKDLGLIYHIFEIERIMVEFKVSLDSIEPDDMTLANLKARIRANLLYYYANSKGLLVAGTSNKSELMIGYFTKYGDGASDIGPIGDLYKTQVRMLAKDMGIPEKIITKVPTAGLIQGQTDENEIGLHYEVLDRILLGLELKLPLHSISSTVGLELNEVERIYDMVTKNRHKRKFSKIPKMGIRTVGTDLRE